ncbi:hypothetical protein Tco_1000455 [Tanacetum coccineum]
MIRSFILKMGSNEETNAAGTDTRPPMLVESDYDSWKIRIHRYIRGKPNGKLIWNSIQNGPTPHPMITDPPPTGSTIVPAPRKKHDSEFNEEENKLEMADTQAEIILIAYARNLVGICKNRREDMFDEYERFRAIGNESIHDYFVRFHKLVNDMKITQLEIPTHQMNTKFVNNLPAYWGKYVTNVKQNMDISTTPYVQIYTHYQSIRAHAKKTLKKQEQSTSIVDPLAYVAHTTSAPALSSPSTPSPQPTAQSPNDALMATMTQIANLLSGFQKQFPPTNNQLRTSSNSRTHATVHDGQIVTEPIQRKAPGNVGNTGARGKKEMTTTNMFQANHEDDMIRTLDEGPMLLSLFMANLVIHNCPVNRRIGFLPMKRARSKLVHHQLRLVSSRKEQHKNRTMFPEWCYDYAKQFVEQQLVPFYDHFKKHIQAANDIFFKEVREYEQIFDELEAEYEQCVLDNKNLTIEKKNLLIKNDCLIAECLEKDICSIVLSSDIVVPPSSNCLCEDLRSACDREHTKVLELEAEVLKTQIDCFEYEKRKHSLSKMKHIDVQLKFQNYKQCIDTSSASNAIFEINKLRKQLQGKENTIRNLDAQVNIMKVLNVGSTEGSCDQQALETDRIQLKDTITSLRIQLDGLKVENLDLQTSETPNSACFRDVYPTVQSTFTPKRANWVKPTPLPKKKQVTFQEPPKTSNRPTQKPPVQQNKKPNVPVNLSTRTKPATESRKPMPKSHTRNHRILPSKSVNARRAADHNRKLNFVDHNQFVIRSLKSVNTKTPQAKHSVNHTKKVWKATRNHNVNTY